MVINFLGDSITAGGGASTYDNCYVSLVGKKLGCVVNNFGVGGTRIARQARISSSAAFDEDFNIRIWRMGEADLVFVFGGTNDYGHGDAPLGKMGDGSVMTFYGAFEGLMRQLIEKYGREKLCFILPLQRYNQGGVSDEFPEKPDPHPLRDYISAEVAIIEKYGVDYLDLSGDFPEPDTNAPTELFSDGLHPSDKGHKILADRVCEYVMSRK